MEEKIMNTPPNYNKGQSYKTSLSYENYSGKLKGLNNFPVALGSNKLECWSLSSASKSVVTIIFLEIS
jgi:hypothetical protein